MGCPASTLPHLRHRPHTSFVRPSFQQALQSHPLKWGSGSTELSLKAPEGQSLGVRPKQPLTQPVPGLTCGTLSQRRGFSAKPSLGHQAASLLMRDADHLRGSRPFSQPRASLCPLPSAGSNCLLAPSACWGTERGPVRRGRGGPTEMAAVSSRCMWGAMRNPKIMQPGLDQTLMSCQSFWGDPRGGFSTERHDKNRTERWLS